MIIKHLPSCSAADTDIEASELETTDRSRLLSMQRLETVLNSELTSELSPCNTQTLILQTSRPIIIDFVPDLNFETENKETAKRTDRLLSIVSGGSNLTSEELLINDNIDFLLDSSEKFPGTTCSPSFNLTKSGKSSSVFNTFYSPNLLMQSLPLSHSDSELESSFAWKKNCETEEPGFLIERLDLTEFVAGFGFEKEKIDRGLDIRDVREMREIKEIKEKGQFEDLKEISKIEKQKIMDQMKGMFLNNQSVESGDISGLFEIGEGKGTDGGKKDWGCGLGCGKCAVV
jgi:hypothetical protein